MKVDRRLWENSKKRTLSCVGPFLYRALFYRNVIDKTNLQHDTCVLNSRLKMKWLLQAPCLHVRDMSHYWLGVCQPSLLCQCNDPTLAWLLSVDIVSHDSKSRWNTMGLFAHLQSRWFHRMRHLKYFPMCLRVVHLLVSEWWLTALTLHCVICAICHDEELPHLYCWNNSIQKTVTHPTLWYSAKLSG